jgi:hypothetical protein
MEPRFGADFSGIRVHAGSEAAQLNQVLGARAFTHGQDIYLGAGAEAPGSEAGNRLLAHELTHVVQQKAVEVQRHPETDGTRLQIGTVSTGCIQRQFGWLKSLWQWLKGLGGRRAAAPPAPTVRSVTLNDARVQAGGAQPTAGHVFTAMTHHMQANHWLWVPNYNDARNLLDVPPAQNGSNCKGYANALISLLQDVGIDAQREGQETGYITPDIPNGTVDPGFTGNIVGTRRFSFTNHYWAIANGTRYDPAMNTSGVNPRDNIEYRETRKDADRSHFEATGHGTTVYVSEMDQNHPRGWTMYRLDNNRPADWPLPVQQ